MRHNNLTNYGRDMSGLLKLVKILPQTKIESLECAPAPKCFAIMSAPLDIIALSRYPFSCSSFHSLKENGLSDETEQALKDAASSSVHIIF